MIFLSKIEGMHRFVGYKVLLKDQDYYLSVTPTKTNNPKAPRFQLVFKHDGHPFHDLRLSGLFQDSKNPNLYRGDIPRGGRKQRFTLEIDEANKIVKISKA